MNCNPQLKLSNLFSFHKSSHKLRNYISQPFFFTNLTSSSLGSTVPLGTTCVTGSMNCSSFDTISVYMKSLKTESRNRGQTIETGNNLQYSSTVSRYDSWSLSFDTLEQDASLKQNRRDSLHIHNVASFVYIHSATSIICPTFLTVPTFYIYISIVLLFS